MEKEYLTVSQVTAYINKKLKFDPKLKNIYIKGEISNYKTYASGHSYFTLKDEKSQISAVMFKGRKRFLKFEPEDGMKVIVKGKIEVYEKNGNYQLQATTITEDGIGDLHIAFEQLKKKLQNEGLFDKEHKKEIPKYPKKIGVVTAQIGAAIRDIITTIQKRYPHCEILVFSTLVQGDHAAPQIVSQIRNSQKYDLDTLIVGRGGGSIEDLWPFNEEIVARAIYNCKIPVISAVGHETDNTISDYVADARAPTPTGAAMIAVPDINEVNYRISQLKNRLTKNIKETVTQNRDKINYISKKPVLKNPETIYEIKQMHLDHLINNLSNLSKNILSENKNRLNVAQNSSVFKNPQSIYDAKEIKLDKIINQLNFSSKNIISENRNRLELIKNSKVLRNPQKITTDKKRDLDYEINQINYSSKAVLMQNKNRLDVIKNNKILTNPMKIKNKKEDKFMVAAEKLSILDPLLTLKRGYSITRIDDKVITSSKDVKKGDEVNIELQDGTINTKVI